MKLVLDVHSGQSTLSPSFTHYVQHQEELNSAGFEQMGEQGAESIHARFNRPYQTPTACNHQSSREIKIHHEGALA